MSCMKVRISRHEIKMIKKMIFVVRPTLQKIIIRTFISQATPAELPEEPPSEPPLPPEPKRRGRPRKTEQVRAKPKKAVRMKTPSPIES